MEENTMTNTVTVITGGAGGIGLATAEIIGTKNTILLADVDQSRLDAAKTALAEHGVQAETTTCDITDPVSVASLVQKAQSLGTIQSVVHTAGISPQMGDPFRIATVNALGTIMITEGFLAVAHPGFAIVNVASMGGYNLPKLIVPKRAYKLAFTNPNKLIKKIARRSHLAPKTMRSGLSYALSKNFVIWYSQAIAEKFGAKNARILSVSPGSIDTRMGQLEKDHGAGAMVDVSALKRFGAPNEIAAILAFCASPEASYLTGTDILCDGGTMAAIMINGKKIDTHQL